MSIQRHSPDGEASPCSDDKRYAVAVTTKAEGMDIVLHGLQRQRAERIAARENSIRDVNTNVQLVPEEDLEQREVQLKHPVND
ncbi:hypothetical protein [Haladaptatus caseinilyticus]|uniref:hypothetical protein n=1 Tax=Haladaptatus caseinilyticus TaxID=2993314 RepID=UPI00224B0BBD|nr:hypothetical protein [Haladaptatus caseinilyticus]